MTNDHLILAYCEDCKEETEHSWHETSRIYYWQTGTVSGFYECQECGRKDYV